MAHNASLRSACAVLLVLLAAAGAAAAREFGPKAAATNGGGGAAVVLEVFEDSLPDTGALMATMLVDRRQFADVWVLAFARATW